MLYLDQYQQGVNLKVAREMRGLGLGVVALIGLSGLVVWLDLHGFLAQELEFLGAKALVARYGPEPRMQAIGFVFPPLLVYGAFAVASPITLHVLLGALLVGFLARSMAQIPVARIWRWGWMVLMLSHPALAFTLVLSPSWIVTTLLLMWCVPRLLALDGPQPPSPSASLPLGIALGIIGLGLALLMLVRHEAWSLVPLVGILVWLVYRHEPGRFQLAALVLTLFLSVVFIASWLYVNWLFTDNAWYFLQSAYSGGRIPGTESLVRQRGFLSSWREALIWIALVVPVYVGVAGWGLLCTRRRGPTALILLLPVMLVVDALWHGSFALEMSRFAPALGLLPGLWLRHPPARWWERCGVTAMLVLSLLSSGLLLQRGRFVPQDTFLWQTLTHQRAQLGTEGERWVAQQEAERQVVQVLLERMAPRQQVLMDDETHFAVVHLLNDPSYFIMPYQYEFSPALQQPDLFADYVLVAGPASPLREEDRVLQFWPQLNASHLPGFAEVAQTPYYRLLQRVTRR
jgi:hypothetical protein